MARSSPQKIRHRAFAERMRFQCDNNQNIPPLHHGRLQWFVDQYWARYSKNISPETIRKWLNGEALPRNLSMHRLAEILEVDDAYLAFGRDSSVTQKEQKIRDATADGAVNVVAGLVQMTGGNPAFPDKDDDRANRDKIDLYAIIRGVQYAINVVVSERFGDRWKFYVQPASLNAVVLGIIPISNFCFKILELDPENIEKFGELKAGGFHVYADSADWSEITTFSERF
jgi:transcriptional regulator with XRE-family HTH domain